MTPRFRFLVVALGLVLVASAVAFTVTAGHSWGPYHWARTSNPFTLKLGDNVSGAWDANLTVASSDWSASSVLNTTVVSGGTRPKACRPTDGRVEVCAAKYGNTGWLGIAQIWITGGEHITQCIVKNNDTYFNDPPYNTNSWRQLVMCQEIGHCFGLDHQDENFNNGNLGTCMDYTSNPDGPPSNLHPNSHDYAQLQTIYAHTDSFTTVKRAGAEMPPAMRSLDLSEVKSWGRLVRVEDDGMTALFELDFGHGNRVYTFVILAQDEAGGGADRPERPERPAR